VWARARLKPAARRRPQSASEKNKMLTYRVITPPVIEPVTLTEAKAQCRVDITDDDTFLTDLIGRARETIEKMNWRAFLTQTIELWLEEWPHDDEIELPAPPLQSVTSIVYYDVDDVAHTLSATVYFVDVISEPGQVHLKHNQTWPILTLRDYNAICVTYKAGWAAAADVPKSIKQAVLLLVGHWYENREASIVGAIAREIELGIQALLNLDNARRF
jgi:uncharacterized phiE125 gp8 family phage protein